MPGITIRKVGAGGFWKAIGEHPDPSVVRQLTPFSCVAAVGEMLLQGRGFSVTQQAIIDIIGESTTTVELARFLNEVDSPVSNEKWHGAIVPVHYLKVIAEKAPFGAVLREGKPLGHLVLVTRFVEGMLEIKDPWDGTSYMMTVTEFLRYWNGEVVFKWNLSK